ncbi:hypothetical protein BCR37DRAFT_344702 [Protomyces lactucae-debilis]|uniref:Transcription factor CBF/NF-Y/archaeal histone domain-containing protein n=1 Tax=Protomyces lactucae-debilis TaxID=2754530 RepID=A0A1Y2FNZ4_PROLT|nr:uncharacterized protein BCR37DRAFT_344702 [Protomyces lactucae-debilis]ORY85649.1 hypothetical protein BCR37DRAFT_344702 [Protomyces lactucae-debilis]
METAQDEPIETQQSPPAMKANPKSKANSTASPSGTPKKPAAHNRRLPLARVKKIAKMDEDVNNLSNAAALVIASATERFAAYFAEQSFFYTIAERKKGLNYSHCASAVARLPQLDFLSDVVPQRVQFRDTAAGKQVAPARQEADAAVAVGNGEAGSGAAAAPKKSGEVPAWAQPKAALAATNAQPIEAQGPSTSVTLSSILDPAVAMDDLGSEDVDMEDD